jgi:hypothetical protein
MSRPLPARSVATRIYILPVLNWLIVFYLISWVLPPWYSPAVLFHISVILFTKGWQLYRSLTKIMIGAERFLSIFPSLSLFDEGSINSTYCSISFLPPPG